MKTQRRTKGFISELAAGTQPPEGGSLQLVLGVDPETEHRDRTAITIIGRVDDQLIVEREPRRCHQEAVIGFEDPLGAGMGQLPVADLNAEPAGIEKLLVYLGDAIDDAGDTEGVVVASPFLS